MEHPWKSQVLKRFQSANKYGSEKEYYPPYNALLYSCFPLDEDYIIAPVTYPLANRESIDFTVEYTIEIENKPIFFLEIKSPKNLKNRSSRTNADNQMRDRLGSLIDECPIDALHGISAFGTYVAFYRIDKNTNELFPERIPESDKYSIDTAPMNRWEDNDILNPSIALKVDSLFKDIKGKCSTIKESLP